MKKSGAALLVYAIEQIGVSKTFGIPGTHNAEIYNQISESRLIEPVIVTHELSAGYMADAVSRTTNTIGTLVIVPGAGLTHAMSAIGEAYIDGIPLLVIAGGINKEAGKSFQLNQLNMERVTNGIVKKYFCLSEPENIITTVYEAYDTAIGGEPGPVFIEMPLKTQLMQASVELTEYKKKPVENPFIFQKENDEGMNLIARSESGAEKLNKAANLLAKASFPGIYVGWGALNSVTELEELAELLAAPVSTTIQGISTFTYDQPFHVGIGFGPTSSLVAQNAFKKCDCLLAVGLKFSELATGNYQLEVPENLIHIDINKDVFHKNYLAKVALQGDSKMVLSELIKILKELKVDRKTEKERVIQNIKADKEKYRNSWLLNPGEQMVTPGFFYNALRNNLLNDAIIVADDGKHTLLTAELFPVYKGGYFICPTDYSGMGYGIPAAIGAKMLNRQKMVAAIIGDGALLMCGTELLTAHLNKIGLFIFVFRDCTSQRINEYHKPKKNDAPALVLGAVNIQGFADAVHAKYMNMKNDIEISGVFTKANEFVKKGQSVIIEVNIDYSRKSEFASNLLKSKSSRISFTEKIKMLFK